MPSQCSLPAMSLCCMWSTQFRALRAQSSTEQPAAHALPAVKERIVDSQGLTLQRAAPRVLRESSPDGLHVLCHREREVARVRLDRRRQLLPDAVGRVVALPTSPSRQSDLALLFRVREVVARQLNALVHGVERRGLAPHLIYLRQVLPVVTHLHHAVSREVVEAEVYRPRRGMGRASCRETV